MFNISQTVRSYIAGFIDGDGCIMFQLSKRHDYKWGFQIKASIILYQKTTRRDFLEHMKMLLKVGSIRDRNDGMSEYTIVGLEPVMQILEMLEPYLLLKKEHVRVSREIYDLISSKHTIEEFVQAAKLVDKFGKLNYSKRRTNTSETLVKYLRKHKLYPRID